MKILLISVFIVYFIGIYPTYYFYQKILFNTLAQMVDDDLLDEDKKITLNSICKNISIKIAFTPMINTLSLIVFTCMSMDAIQRYVFLRLKAMDVDNLVKDMLDEEE